ncbi:MAG: RlmE family RNA methyltransferase [Candidatus Woesearchaeota archaeon]|jgi:23S rRNA (uridine2552-2'-O)-methyltransferase|nr:RlmE family RNA methyltransferase [Candidatus Woesearchaeota archaeon]
MTIPEYIKKRNKEQYFKQAKEKKVRARSYFKLKQLNEKYELLKEGHTIIDLGAAPGGWLQYIDETLKTGKIIGIDLLEIEKQKEFSEKIEIIEDDFNNIEEYLKEGEKFNLVLSDMAPEFSGNSQVDRGRTHKLNMITIEFCKKHLKQGGKLLFKSFEGEDLPNVKKKAKEIFEVVKEFKPKSSQQKSCETFMMCFNKLR